MILTREQAAETWCPMVRLAACTPTGGVAAGQTVMNRLQKDRVTVVPDSARCIADQCAMWRWHDKSIKPRDARTWWPEEDEPVAEPLRLKEVPASAVWIPLSGEGDDLQGGCWEEPQAVVDADNAAASARRRGYCGLAGVPAIWDGE